MTPEKIGSLIREMRQLHRLTQPELAVLCGTGIRFIVDVEKGKSTCQIGKVLTVLSRLGLSLDINVEKQKPIP